MVAVARTEFARDWRNRHIAHRDLALSVDPASKGLAEASRLRVREALEAIAAVMSRIHSRYTGADLSFDIPGGPGDALDLLRLLREGQRSEREREERFRAGKPLPEDLNPRGWEKL